MDVSTILKHCPGLTREKWAQFIDEVMGCPDQYCLSYPKIRESFLNFLNEETPIENLVILINMLDNDDKSTVLERLGHKGGESICEPIYNKLVKFTSKTLKVYDPDNTEPGRYYLKIENTCDDGGIRFKVVNDKGYAQCVIAQLNQDNSLSLAHQGEIVFENYGIPTQDYGRFIKVIKGIHHA